MFQMFVYRDPLQLPANWTATLPAASDAAISRAVVPNPQAAAHATPSAPLAAEHAPNGRPISLRCGLRYDQLLRYVEAQPSLSILEIGVARAANAMRLLAYADLLGGKARYTGIDLFDQLSEDDLRVSYCIENKRPLSREETILALRHMLGHDIISRVELYEGYSNVVLPQLRLREQQYDLIFIDGGHDYAAVSSDWKDSQHLLAPGGAIVFDDFPNWGIAGAIAEIDRRAWDIRLLDHIDVFANHRADDSPSSKRMHLLVELRRR